MMQQMLQLGIATLPSVKVRRGQLGIAATTHSANDCKIA